MSSAFSDLPKGFAINTNPQGYSLNIPNMTRAQWALVLLAMNGALKTTIETLAPYIADEDQRIAVLMRLKQKFVSDIKSIRCDDDAIPLEEQTDGMTAALLLVEAVFSGAFNEKKL